MIAQMRGGNVTASVPRILPLPLGEGRGEGLATKTQNTSFPFFIGADRKNDGRDFSSHVTQLRPHPNPPKGRGHLHTRSWHTGWPDAYRNRLNQRRDDSGFKADPVAADHGE